MAREAWLRDEPAIIRAGIHFDAVRIPAEHVHHLAGSDGRDAVERAFARVGIETAVIADLSRRWYYALVPPRTTEAEHPTYLGVPAPHRADPPGTHWLLSPPDGEDALCDPASVRKLVAS
ncbi:hypothetical protein FHS39_004911 [Streptomyces olivoverticillatus]|uniref:Uncharacterized protein n=1 Tax=Streptomyces olivoverticillatus TaxID=66427 RepID=A0A7W7PMX9_9ACTN|nr:hypothetical protein [Streptomyces olivoverticillatus]MBB4895832.1 hypothetical protein [Streptomyces olivoverticillatus]